MPVKYNLKERCFIIYKILEDAIKNKASDLHLTDRLRPILRIDGKLIELEGYDVNNAEILSNFRDEILSKENIENYKRNKSVDSSLEYKGTRFRVHVYRQKECDAFSLRVIPSIIPNLSEMNLPSVLGSFTELRNGLVLITGVTGSGKSTTLASLIGKINKEQNKHIITIEDPIEFIHNHNKSIINQREIGTDVTNFSDAVISAMREDPDILMLGEMRDLDTIRNAITMAETGHLVLATLHTKSVSETVDRIIDVFPPNQQDQIRVQLSNSIKGIVSQELLPGLNGGRVPCCEILIVDDSIKNLIRTKANPSSIIDKMQMAHLKTGSQTRVQALANLLKRGLISNDVSMEYTTENEKEELTRLLSLSEG